MLPAVHSFLMGQHANYPKKFKKMLLYTRIGVTSAKHKVLRHKDGNCASAVLQLKIGILSDPRASQFKELINSIKHKQHAAKCTQRTHIPTAQGLQL